MKKYTLKQLQALPTRYVGQAADLKMETEVTRVTRVWLSRCSVEDGEPYNNKVTVQELTDNGWVIKQTYQAR